MTTKRVAWIGCAVMCAMAVACVSAGVTPAQDQAALAVKKLRCEWKVDPVIDVARPRFSWELESPEKNVAANRL